MTDAERIDDLERKVQAVECELKLLRVRDKESTKDFLIMDKKHLDEEERLTMELNEWKEALRGLYQTYHNDIPADLDATPEDLVNYICVTIGELEGKIKEKENRINELSEKLDKLRDFLS